MRLLRAKHNLSQRQFAEKVFNDSSGHGFKSLSRIEKGIQPLTDDQRHQIEAHFGVSIASLVSEATRGGSSAAVMLRSNPEYFQIHEGFISKAHELSKLSEANEAPANVWFFHPVSELPVLRSAFVKVQWVANIRRGVNKHLVWPLPVTNKDDLRAFFDLGVEVLNSAQNRSAQIPNKRLGKIFFWVINPAGSQPRPQANDFYEDLQRKAENLTELGLVLHPVLKENEEADLRRILTFNCVVLNMATDVRLPPYAASYLDDVGSDKDGEWISGWLFNGKRTCSALCSIVETLKVLLDETSRKMNEGGTKL